MLKKLSVAVAAMLMGAMVATVPQPAYAQVEVWEACKGSQSSAVCKASKQDTSINSIIANIVKVMLTLLGGVAVIVIIYSGFRYITSNGDAGKIASAKNTLMYAIVGLIVAIFAYVIVDLTIKAATSGSI